MKYRLALGMLFVLFLSLLSACGSSGAGNATAGTPTRVPASGTVQVTLHDTEVESSRTTFVAGQAYSFVVTNKGTMPHNFIIDVRRKAPAPQGSEDRILYMIDQTKLPPGTTKSFTYTFPLSAPETIVQFATHLAGPSGSGVTIPVDVKR